MATTGCDESLRTTALFELGGTQKTIEAIEGDYQFIEPLQREDLLEENGQASCTRTTTFDGLDPRRSSSRLCRTIP